MVTSGDCVIWRWHVEGREGCSWRQSCRGLLYGHVVLDIISMVPKIYTLDLCSIYVDIVQYTRKGEYYSTLQLLEIQNLNCSNYTSLTTTPAHTKVLENTQTKLLCGISMAQCNLLTAVLHSPGEILHQPIFSSSLFD